VRKEAASHLPAALLLAGGAASLYPAVSAAGALAIGAAIALTVGNPHRARTQRLAARLLQACIVGIGAGMSFAVLVSVGAAGLLYTAAVVLGTLTAGLLLGRLLRVDGEAALLISSGTGICGGSAIAAVGSAIRARAETMSVALAVVFVLNAVALYAFPAVGLLLDLSQAQFGTWAALAIHDTSSVVGAASVYGAAALERATVLKLARALWIVPLALAAALHARRTGQADGKGSVAVPWFILFFVLAAVARSVAPAAALPAFDLASRAARMALPVVLFLIGAGLTRATLRTIGLLPMGLAALLWLLVAASTLAAVMLWAAP
jgi:uncharacterized integral membrane protein (TIGR00698 family)